MLHTFQGSYVLLAEASQDISGFDGTTVGATLDWHDLPANRPEGESPNIRDDTQGTIEVGNEANGCVIIAACVSTATENKNGAFELFGWAEGGPAEYIADVSCTTGLIWGPDDSTTALYVDTMVIDTQYHVKNLTVKDSANNRICKLQFDLAGLKYISCRWYDITGKWESYIRVY